MSKLVKDIVDVCLKEDLQRVLQKTTELKEVSAFGKEFAQQMKQKGEGDVYRSKITGQNILLKYATPKTAAPKPAAPASVPRPAPRPATPQAPAPKPQTTSPGQLTLPPISRNAAPKPAAPPVSTASLPGLSTGKQTLPSVNVGRPSATPTPSWKDQGAVERQRMASEKPSTAPTPNIPKVSSNRTDVEVTGTSADFGGRKYRLPAEMKDKTGGKEAGIDYGRSEKAQRGIRSFDAGKIDTSKFNYPGKVGGQSRALEPPTKSNAPSAPTPTPAPETPKTDTSPVSSALRDRISPSQLASNPANLVSKSAIKGRESSTPVSEPKPAPEPAPKAPVSAPAPAAAPGPMMAPQTSGSVTPKPDTSDEPPPPKANNVNESVVTVGSYKYRVI